MIVFKFELTNARGQCEIVIACGHSKSDMWHDLAEKVASRDMQAEVDTIKIEFVDDVSVDMDL